MVVASGNKRGICPLPKINYNMKTYTITEAVMFNFYLLSLTVRMYSFFSIIKKDSYDLAMDKSNWRDRIKLYSICYRALHRS